VLADAMWVAAARNVLADVMWVAAARASTETMKNYSSACTAQFRLCCRTISLLYLFL
jgi:hypothetical protein